MPRTSVARTGWPAASCRWPFEGGRAAELAEAIARQRRVTDQVLTSRRRDGRTTVTLLLPMTDDLGIARYLGRVEAAVREMTGTSLAEAGVRVVHHAAIDDSDRLARLDLDGEIATDDDMMNRNLEKPLAASALALEAAASALLCAGGGAPSVVSAACWRTRWGPLAPRRSCRAGPRGCRSRTPGAAPGFCS